MVESLFYCEQDTIMYIKGIGFMTQKLCYDLREFIRNRLNTAPCPLMLYFDLSQSEYLDSSFMGLLVGLHKMFKEKTGNGLEVVNPSPSSEKLMRGLGLHKIFTILKKDISLPSDMKLLHTSQKTNHELLLHAHEELINLSKENSDKFAALREILIHQKKKKEEIS